MKTQTLVKIARDIEKEFGITLPKSVTVNQAVDDLKRIAGNCRTKWGARLLIGTQIYQLNSSHL